ncbi:MAG TPA: thioredoxin family protein [Thermoanaerobaculia bacterium]|nr:thioredoxin family protein [Thermoanaerobaculia bacterium]
MLVGVVTREATEEAVPAWVEVQTHSIIDPVAAQSLTTVPPGAEVEVIFGTWCGDSKREVARLWRALDEVGGEVPFGLSWVAVSRDKLEPADRLAGVNVEYVPTFVVRRGGREVGRIVETSRQGIEKDLLDLLTGAKQGVISESRPELESPGDQR